VGNVVVEGAPRPEEPPRLPERDVSWQQVGESEGERPVPGAEGGLTEPAGAVYTEEPTVLRLPDHIVVAGEGAAGPDRRRRDADVLDLVAGRVHVHRL